MASNFGIATEKKGDGFVMKLQGDFDATSAYELIYAIKKLPDKTVKISIYTNGVKDIHPYGLEVFHRNMRPFAGQYTKIVFTGNNASKLSLGNSQYHILAVIGRLETLLGRPCVVDCAAGRKRCFGFAGYNRRIKDLSSAPMIGSSKFRICHQSLTPPSGQTGCTSF